MNWILRKQSLFWVDKFPNFGIGQSAIAAARKRRVQRQSGETDSLKESDPVPDGGKHPLDLMEFSLGNRNFPFCPADFRRQVCGLGQKAADVDPAFERGNGRFVQRTGTAEK